MSFCGWCLINSQECIFSFLRLKKRHSCPKFICIICSSASSRITGPKKSKLVDGFSGEFCSTPTNPKGRGQSGKRKKSGRRRKSTRTKTPKPEGGLTIPATHTHVPISLDHQNLSFIPIIHSASPLSGRALRREGQNRESEAEVSHRLYLTLLANLVLRKVARWGPRD